MKHTGCFPSYRTVVERLEGLRTVNVNNEIGLDPLSSYTRSEHLEDLASDGLLMVGRQDDLFVFSDGSMQVLKERLVAIDMNELDEEERGVIMAATLMVPPSATLYRATLPC